MWDCRLLYKFLNIFSISAPPGAAWASNPLQFVSSKPFTLETNEQLSLDIAEHVAPSPFELLLALKSHQVYTL